MPFLQTLRSFFATKVLRFHTSQLVQAISLIFCSKRNTNVPIPILTRWPLARSLCPEHSTLLCNESSESSDFLDFMNSDVDDEEVKDWSTDDFQYSRQELLEHSPYDSFWACKRCQHGAKYKSKATPDHTYEPGACRLAKKPGDHSKHRTPAVAPPTLPAGSRAPAVSSGMDKLPEGSLGKLKSE